MVEFKHLNVVFNKNTSLEKEVFSDLNLDVNDGDFICLLGTNGAGKTTLFNALLGRIKYKGDIIIDGVNVNKLKTYKRSQNIGVVYQDPLMGTAPNLTVEENLLLAKKEKNILFFKDKKKYLQECREYLKRFELGLEDNFKTPVKELSGGMRQALTLFMAANRSPKILLLDEHVAALNPNTAEKVMQITNEIIKEKNILTMMIIHNVEMALRYGNRLIILDGGNIVLDIKGDAKSNMTKDDLLRENFHHLSDANILSK